MELIVLIAFIYLLAVLMAWVTKIDIAYLFAPAIFFISGWEFVFGILGYLNLGMESLVFFIGATLLVFLIGSREFRSHLLKSTYAPSTVAFISLSLISLYKTKDWLLSQWDEFSHWGAVVKAMYEYSALGPATPADLWAINYPPGISLFQYFVMELSDGWREGLLFWATHLIVISIIVSVLAKASYRYTSEIFLKLFFALLASSVFFNNFDNIYADPVLALAFGFLIFIAIQASCLDGRWWIALAITAGFITLTKPIGIYFAAAAILVNIVATLFRVKFSSGKKASLAFVPALVSLTTIGSVWFAWRSYALSFGTSNVGSSQDFLSEFNLASGDEKVIASFSNAFFHLHINPSYSASMPSLLWTIICGLFFVIWTVLNGKKNRGRNIALGITLFVTTAGYFALILYSYLNVFSPGEAANLASYERYIGTWYQGVFFALSILIFSEFSLAKQFDSEITTEEQKGSLGAHRKVSLFLVVFLSLAMISNSINYVSMLRGGNSRGIEFREKFNPVTRSIREAGIPEQSKVWIIAQHTAGFEYYVLRYEMIQADFSNVAWSIGSPNGVGDIWTDPSLDVEKWSKELLTFDYVVLYSTTESFNNEFGSLFESGIPETDSVYKVIKNDNTVSLSKIN